MTTRKQPHFDDFLGVMQLDLSDAKLILFHGCSGSGKSGYLGQLCHHSSFANHSPRWFFSDPSRHTTEATAPGDSPRLALVDELTRVGELRTISKLLRRFDAVAVATHLHPRWFALLRARWPARVFHTDLGHEKIERYLSRLGHSFSGSDVHAMCAQYGASYAIADIVREHRPRPDFSDSWAHFSRFANLDTRRNPANRHWRIQVDESDH